MNCPNCGLKQSDPFFSQGSGTCPNCGHVFRAESSTPAQNPIAQYFDDLKTLLLKPKQFFRQMPRDAGLAQPLAFALIAHWIGSAISYLWTAISTRTGEEVFEKWAGVFGNGDQIDVIRRSAPWATARHAFTQWFWGMSSVIADPFYTLISLLIGSFFVFLGARLLVGIMSDAPAAAPAVQRRHEVTYESAVRIMAYGKVASIFLAIPMGGALIAWLYGFYISTVGAKEVYRIGTGRGMLIVLFPQVLFILVIFAFVALLFLLGISLLGSFFS
jgi:hypothetical protein